MKEIIKAYGHGNVLATHKTTLEFTKETHLTPRGDCIVAVGADKGLLELSENFKKSLKNEKTRLSIKIKCGNLEETITACGHPNLTLTHPTDMVVRKSDFICPRTLAIRADKAACDLNRKLVNKLEDGNDVEIIIKILE